MKQVRIGDDSVGVLGLGCMGMSFAYGPGDDDESSRVLHRALELGVNHWDTADMYGAGKNEELLAQTLKTRRDEVFLATKFANVYDRSMTSHQDLVAAGAPHIVDNTSVYIRKAIERSLTRLGVDHVDLYYMHRVDDRVPIEETVGTMSELVQEGKVRFLGLSEVTASTLQRALTVHPIAAVQNEFSLWTRDFELDVLPLTAAVGTAFVPYSPLGRGFLTGQIKSIDDLAPEDWRRNNPRFQGENFQKNLDIVASVRDIAIRHGAKPSQVALAWVLSKGNNVAPIPGTKRVRYLEENAASADLVLTPADLAALDRIAPAAGERYPEVAMQFTAR